MERKFEVKGWATRGDLSLSGMCIVDACGDRFRVPDGISAVTSIVLRIHDTETYEKQKTKAGLRKNAAYQGRCRICNGKQKSKYICSECCSNLQREVVLSH